MDIIFFRNKEKPTFYLIHQSNDAEEKAQILFEKFTKVGIYENSGYPDLDVEIAYIYKTDLGSDFFDFLADEIATNHSENRLCNSGPFRSWYEFKSYEPEKWVADFHEYERLKYDELRKSLPGIQTTLF